MIWPTANPLALLLTGCSRPRPCVQLCVTQKAAIVKELKEASSSRLVYVGPSSYGRPGLSTVVIAVIIAAGAGALIAVLIICVCCKKSNLSKKPKGAIG